MQKQSVYGSTGYVGKNYLNMYPMDSIAIMRDERTPQSNDVLYMISTTDNYNIYNEPNGHLIDIDTNLRILMEVLNEFRKINNNNSEKTFNFISSWFVYGETDLPAKEESYCNPKGFYSITKRAAEQLVISYCETFGINYRILRLANVVGNNAPFSAKKNALEYMIDQISNNQQVNLYDAGEVYRDFIHISDCVRAINLVVTSGEKNCVYNIGTGIPLRLIDAIVTAKLLIESSSNINYIQPPNFHKLVQVKSMYMDSTKLTQLGFVPEFSGLEIIKKLIGEKLK